MDDEKLDKNVIVREAQQLLREDGIDKLTMRKLAARLGIRAPTLYWYFPDRSSILRQIIIELLQGTIDRVPECESWQEWMQAFGLSLWRTNCDSPFATLLLQSAEVNDATVVAWALKALRSEAAKYDVDEAIFLRAHSDVNAFTTGYSVFWHSNVSEQLSSVLDVDDAVLEGIGMIIAYWDGKSKANATAVV